MKPTTGEAGRDTWHGSLFSFPSNISDLRRCVGSVSRRKSVIRFPVTERIRKAAPA